MPHAAAMTRAGRLQAESSGKSLIESLLFVSDKKFAERDDTLLSGERSPPKPDRASSASGSISIENELFERDLGVFEL
jgi:hypothetical protein